MLVRAVVWRALARGKRRLCARRASGGALGRRVECGIVGRKGAWPAGVEYRVSCEPVPQEELEGAIETNVG